ncbi:DMT family transporter [Rhizobiales bacterium]|uniref:DMT family transporter n=1 Tax=Hongsoonwoonella zoysiae TaxID=2821844 RepID=UPI00156166F9|nr:DMT family transporter [Hongsoonwoonella zoysiae]NRG18374.1 DMT family transporter [Hongsoonwoonella zoysiae]
MLQDNRRAIGAISIAMLAGIGNDVFAKLAAENLPLGEIMFLRGLMALAIVTTLGIAMRTRVTVRMFRHPTVLARTAANGLGTVLFLAALFHLPLANSIAILQALPLVITAGAAIFLSETVGWQRWTAILAGFAGVLIVARPGAEGFDYWAAVAFAGVLLSALRDLISKRTPAEIPSIALNMASLIAIILIGLSLSVRENWLVPTGREVLLLGAAAAFFTVANLLIIVSLRLGDIAAVSPFRYTIVVWAILLGFLVWDEVPDALTLTGSTIIVGAGLFTYFRERHLARSARVAGPVSVRT